jgi:hypothetical protein
MKYLYHPQIPMMTIYATSNELVTIGTVIVEFLAQSERIPNKTPEHLDLVDLLRSLQGRLVSATQLPPFTREGLQ